MFFFFISLFLFSLFFFLWGWVGFLKSCLVGMGSIKVVLLWLSYVCRASVSIDLHLFLCSPLGSRRWWRTSKKVLLLRVNS